MNYDAVADPANFVEDIYNEEKTVLPVPENNSQMTDTVEQDNGEIVTSNKIDFEHLDTTQGGDVSTLSI